MNIGTSGAGHIGATLAQKLAAAGHHVKVANSRGAASLHDLAARIGVTAAAREAAAKDVQAIIAAPLHRVLELAEFLRGVRSGVPVIDTSNDHPVLNGQPPALDAGQVESLWVSEQLGRRVIKAWNAVLAETLRSRGKPAGVAGRLALPVAGDDAAGKRLAAQLVEATGFEAVDAGPLSESWRQQPGTPAYCTELTLSELHSALQAADQQRAPSNRDAATQRPMTWRGAPTHDDMIQNSRDSAV